MNRLPDLAPSPEQQQLHAAVGLLRNRQAECEERAANLSLVVPEQRQEEAAFLSRWAAELDQEEHRVLTWARDLQQRQIQSGELIPQVDGSFLVGTPATPTHLKVAVGGGRVAAKFWRAGFRSKVGLVGLLMVLVGIPLTAASGSEGTAALIVIGVLFLILWFFASLFARPAMGAAMQGGTNLMQARALAQQQAQEQAHAAAQRADEAAAAAEQRRREAIARAQGGGGAAADDEWE